MTVSFDDDCFRADAPVQPDWEELDDPSEATGHFDGGWEAEPRFRVVTDNVERAADALLVAASRFMNVGQSGVEHAVPSDTPEDRTPSLTTVSVDDEAAYVAANTSEWLSHEMAATLKRILVEELTAVGVSATIGADYNPMRGLAAAPWPRS